MKSNSWLREFERRPSDASLLLTISVDRLQSPLLVRMKLMMTIGEAAI
jgi:hypothetical protein